MESRDSIRKELINIGYQHGYKGDMVDLAADLLSYAVYTNQVEVLNAAQESSLATAKTMNSKIKQCMNVMYSVYRGENARVLLNFTPKTKISVDKFDCVYESNTFKLYASRAYEFAPYVQDSATPETVQMECIFSKVTLFEYEVEINSNNKYYVDVPDQYGHPLKDISEDIRVFIDGIEYPITRDFHEHINCPIASTTDDRDNLDKLFVLTIPDYGIRIFKRGYYKTTEGGQSELIGYFPIGSKVKVQCMQYTKGLASDSKLTNGDINPDEFSKILIPGTILVPFSDPEHIGKDNGTGRIMIDQIDREDGTGVLYNANTASRVQSQILSNSDVCHLFTEHFIKYIKSASMRYDVTQDATSGNGTLMIFYVPRIDGFRLTEVQLKEFRDKYRSYFIATDIQALPGQLLRVDLSLEIYLNSSNELGDQITDILNEYTNKLTERSNLLDSEFIDNPDLDYDYDYYNMMLNKKILTAQINKLDEVKYLSEVEFSMVTYYGQSKTIENADKLPTSFGTIFTDDQGNERAVRVPVYYQFTPIIQYKNSYESIS